MEYISTAGDLVWLLSAGGDGSVVRSVVWAAVPSRGAGPPPQVAAQSSWCPHHPLCLVSPGPRPQARVRPEQVSVRETAGEATPRWVTGRPLPSNLWAEGGRAKRSRVHRLGEHAALAAGAHPALGVVISNKTTKNYKLSQERE